MFLSVSALEGALPWFPSTTEGPPMSGIPSAKFGETCSIVGSRPAPLPSEAGPPQGRATTPGGRSPAWVPGSASRVRGERPRFCGDGFVAFVRAAFPASPAQHLAHLIGCPSSTAEKWLRREGAPSADYLGSMIGIFGPAFAASVISPAPAWAVEAARTERRRALERELDQLKP
jgi:hypothetical protein